MEAGLCAAGDSESEDEGQTKSACRPEPGRPATAGDDRCLPVQASLGAHHSPSRPGRPRKMCTNRRPEARVPGCLLEATPEQLDSPLYKHTRVFR